MNDQMDGNISWIENIKEGQAGLRRRKKVDNRRENAAS